jgi:hypothetical protein
MRFDMATSVSELPHHPLPHKATVCDNKIPPRPFLKETVKNPPHYNKHLSGLECIEITRHMNFNLGNAIKYIWRADLKDNAIEDLKKAAWYIDDEIKRREKIPTE